MSFQLIQSIILQFQPLRGHRQTENRHETNSQNSDLDTRSPTFTTNYFSKDQESTKFYLVTGGVILFTIISKYAEQTLSTFEAENKKQIDLFNDNVGTLNQVRFLLALYTLYIKPFTRSPTGWGPQELALDPFLEGILPASLSQDNLKGLIQYFYYLMAWRKVIKKNTRRDFSLYLHAYTFGKLNLDIGDEVVSQNRDLELLICSFWVVFIFMNDLSFEVQMTSLKILSTSLIGSKEHEEPYFKRARNVQDYTIHNAYPSMIVRPLNIGPAKDARHLPPQINPHG